MRQNESRVLLGLIMVLGLLIGGPAWAEAPVDEDLPPCPLTCAVEDLCQQPDEAEDPARCELPTDRPGRLVIGHPSAFPSGIDIGVDALQMVVDPRGFLTFNDPWAEAVPMPLEVVDRPLVAAFWADLQVGPCPDPDADGPLEPAPPGRIIRERVDQGVRIVWTDMPLSGCPDDADRATFSVELNTDALGRLRRARFEYRTLPDSTVIEPRAGFDINGTKIELLPDLGGEVMRDRAKRLTGYGTDRTTLADGRPGPIIRGVWLVELGPEGDILGDPDRDGVRNADNCPSPNPWQWNSDGDEFGDACDPNDDNDAALDLFDNCPLTHNPGQEDRDGDGVGDHCVDSDGDLLVDAIDRCPHDADPAALDLDGDGVPDACDPDIDGDDVIFGWPNPWSPWWVPGDDNCPWLRTFDRGDRDKDGVGDACDLRPGRKCNGFECLLYTDSDGDTIADAIDVCPLVPDPLQGDEDGDDVGDACDWDQDNDGIPDLYVEFDLLCDPAICGPR